MKRKLAGILIAALVAGCLGGCGSAKKGQHTQIQVFAAASLNTVMGELSEMYGKDHPGVEISINADSSCTLLTQSEDGYACDIFFCFSTNT